MNHLKDKLALVQTCPGLMSGSVSGINPFTLIPCQSNFYLAKVNSTSLLTSPKVIQQVLTRPDWGSKNLNS